LTYVVGFVLTVVAIGFGMRKQSGQHVRELVINIAEDEGNFFIDQTEAVDLLNAAHTDYVLSLTKEQLDLRELEQRMEKHAFVADAQIFMDVQGVMNVNITQARPVARLLFGNGKGKYIDQEGHLLPLNGRHTARVPIIQFGNELPWESSVLENELGHDLMELIRFIEGDPFWKAQIAHMIIDGKNDITMIPQVTKQEIRFGYPEDIERKFKKLKIFYKEILPAKGWNTYAFVDVKYKDQIVCE
jgi:cell division protein FtsQ